MEDRIPMTTLTAPVSTGARIRLPIVVAATLLLVALVAGLAILAGSRAPSLPTPYGPAANGTLLVETDTDLLAVDPASGRQTTFHSPPGLALGPTYALDGSKVAWFGAADEAAADAGRLTLTIAGADGSDVRPLGEFAASWLAWAPSGDRVAITHDVAGTSTISLVDTKTGAATPLDLGMPAEQAAFRPPNGDQLVFRGRADDGSWGLYLVDSDGSDVVPLELDQGFRDDRNYGINADYYFLEPAWSADGRRLAFHTLEESTGFDADPGFRLHVALLDDLNGVRAEAPLLPADDVDDEFPAAWLPDGTGLVTRRVEEGTQSLVLWPVSADLQVVGPVRELDFSVTPGPDGDVRFVVAPDGANVLAWVIGETAWQVPVSGAAATQTAMRLGPATSWQRIAP